MELFLFFKILFIYFLERGEGKEEERERNISVRLPLMSPPTRDLAHNPGMCPDWESNLQPFGLQTCAQSTELYQPGLSPLFTTHKCEALSHTLLLHKYLKDLWILQIKGIMELLCSAMMK